MHLPVWSVLSIDSVYPVNPVRLLVTTSQSSLYLYKSKYLVTTLPPFFSVIKCLVIFFNIFLTLCSMYFILGLGTRSWRLFHIMTLSSCPSFYPLLLLLIDGLASKIAVKWHKRVTLLLETSDSTHVFLVGPLESSKMIFFYLVQKHSSHFCFYCHSVLFPGL